MQELNSSILQLHRLIIDRLFGDDDIVGVAFPESAGRDADELGVGAQIVEVAGADIAHPGPQSAHELENDVAERTTIRHARLNAFSDKFAGRVLAVAVTRSAAHRFE